MRAMVDGTAANWVALAFAGWQSTAQSTQICWQQPPTVTDREVRAEIARAHSLGLKVCLKPVVNCADGTWRAHINFFDVDVPPEPKWSDWWKSYTAFITHYAAIAAARRLRDVLRRLRDGADRPEGRRLARPDRRGARGVLRPDHLQLRQVPGGPASRGGTPWTSSPRAATTRWGRGRSSWTGSKPSCAARASRSCSSRPAARAAPARSTSPTTGRCRARRASRRRPSGTARRSRRPRSATGSAVSCSGTGRPTCRPGPWRVTATTASTASRRATSYGSTTPA